MSEWRGETVLVTGGAGFIGSHLTEALVDRGATVRVADNFSRGARSRIAAVEPAVEVLPVDLSTARGAMQATAGVDQVFHLAASVGGIHYIQQAKVAGLTPSVLMNQHVLEAARLTGVDRLLFASSACIYRQTHDGLNEFSEAQAVPANPESTYGWAKVLGEVACRAYHDDTDLDCGMVRVFNCYGPREHLDPATSHVIPSLCRKVIAAEDGGRIEVFGDGTQERGFVYVTDLVDGLLEAMAQKTDGDPINLGNATEVVTINEVAERLIAISGKDLTIEHDTGMPTGTDRYCADTTKLDRELDWTPTVPLEEGLRRTYEWAEAALRDQSAARAAADGGEP